MASTLQIRDIPEDVSRALKARAAEAGQSLSQYALAELTKAVRKPRIDVLWQEIQANVTVERESLGAADLIRAERDARG